MRVARSSSRCFLKSSSLKSCVYFFFRFLFDVGRKTAGKKRKKKNPKYSYKRNLSFIQVPIPSDTFWFIYLESNGQIRQQGLWKIHCHKSVHGSYIKLRLTAIVALYWFFLSLHQCSMFIHTNFNGSNIKQHFLMLYSLPLSQSLVSRKSCNNKLANYAVHSRLSSWKMARFCKKEKDILKERHFSLTVLGLRMNIFDLPNENSSSGISNSLNNTSTPALITSKWA